MNEYATKEEFHELTSKVIALEKDVKEGFTQLNKTLETVAKQCSEIKHNDNNSAQFRIDTTKVLHDIKLGLEDHENINHVGIFGQVKNNHAEYKADYKELKKELQDHKEEHNALDARVMEIETDKKVSKLKRGLIYGGFTAIGSGLKPAIVWVIDKVF